MTDRILYTIPEVAEALGLGRSTIYELIRTGALTSVLVSTSRRVRSTDLEAYVAGLATAAA